MACQAGMMPQQFWDSCMDDIVVLLMGYAKRNHAEWEQTRALHYLIGNMFTKPEERISIYEWMPLSGDPTAEELEKIIQRENEQRKETIVQNVNKTFQQYGYNIQWQTK